MNKYLAFYFKNIVAWYRAPFNANWEEIRDGFIEFGTGLVKVIVIILIWITWAFMYVFSPIVELLATPIRLWNLKRISKRNQKKINDSQNLRALRGHLIRYSGDAKRLKEENAIIEFEHAQKTVDMLEKRVVELELGMTER